MMGEVFKLFGTIGINNKEAQDALDQTEKKGQQTTKKLTGFFSGMSGKIGKIFKGVGSGLATVHQDFNRWGGKINTAMMKGVVAGAKALAVGGVATMAAAGATLIKSMNLAGELEQNLGGSEAVFGKYAEKMQKIGTEAYSKMGLSQSEFLASANIMGSLYQGVGFSVKESMDMSSASMQRAADVASIMGIDIDSAMEAVNGMAKGNFTMMDNLGVAINDTAIGNYALSKGIEKSTAKMSTQEKVGLATQMFMEKTAQYAGNYAKENDTLSGSLQTAKAALSNFMSGAGEIDDVISTGMNFAKIAGQMAVELAPKLLTGLITVFQELVPKIPSIVSGFVSGLADVIGQTFGEEAQSKFEGVVDKIKIALDGLKTAFDFIVKYKDIFTPIAVGIGTIVGMLSAWNAISKIATGIQLVFNTVLNANPISLIILAIVGVVSALVYFFTQTETGIKIWKKFTQFLSDSWNAVKDKAIEIWTAISEFMVNLWNSVKEKASEIWTALVDGISNIIQSLSDFLKNTWETIKTVAQTVWNVIFAVVGGIISSYIAIWKGIFEGFKIYLGLIWEGIKAVASFVWGIIGDTVMSIVNKIVSTAAAIFNGFKNVITTIFNAVRSVIITVWNAISTAVMTVINALVSVATTVFNGWKNILTTLFNAIRSVITTVWNAIKNVITNVVNAIVSSATNIFNNLKNTITTIFNTIRTVASNVWNAIKNVISTVVGVIVDTATNLFNKLKNTIQTIWNNIKSAISDVVNSVKNTISNVWGGIQSIVSGIFNKAKDAIETPMKKARDTIKGIIDAIKGFFSFKISWPKIPLPHFGITPAGWKIGDLLKGVKPTLGIDWYAEGGIMTKPTAFGLNGDRLMVGGEAGAEAIAPIDTLLDYVIQAVRLVMAENHRENDGDINVTQYITSPEPLTPREVARETKLSLQDLAILKK